MAYKTCHALWRECEAALNFLPESIRQKILEGEAVAVEECGTWLEETKYAIDCWNALQKRFSMQPKAPTTIQ